MRFILMVPLAAAALGFAPQSAGALPAWARKYNMNCSSCHFPTVPRLNATGFAFKWAGYRMPGEIGKNAEVKKIEEYLAARAVMQYVYTKTENEPADENGLVVPSASIFAGGAIGTNYGAYLEFERSPDGAIDLIGQISGVWGKENGFGGLRVGQGHLLVGGVVAGFDRPTGILSPLPLSEPLTRGVPFKFTGDAAGVEAFYVFRGMYRTSLLYANGLAAGGEEMEGGATPTSHDWVFTNQLMLDDIGAAVAAVGYFGAVRGLDAAQDDLKSRYYRLGLSANKYLGPFEAQAGYTYANNSRLPIGETLGFTSPKLSGNGYWLYGGYTVKPTFWTVYSRWEVLDPDRKTSDDAMRRFVFGSVLPVNVPEYLRLGLEYFLDTPQGSGALKRQGARAEVLLAF